MVAKKNGVISNHMTLTYGIALSDKTEDGKHSCRGCLQYAGFRKGWPCMGVMEAFTRINCVDRGIIFTL